MIIYEQSTFGSTQTLWRTLRRVEVHGLSQDEVEPWRSIRTFACWQARKTT